MNSSRYSFRTLAIEDKQNTDPHALIVPCVEFWHHFSKSSSQVALRAGDEASLLYSLLDERLNRPMVLRLKSG